VLWVAIVVLAGTALIPLLLTLRHARPAVQASPALAFYRDQLAELDRERDEGLISPNEHKGARLEIERRLLAAATPAAARAAPSHRWPILAASAIIPLLAILFYLDVGSPGLPAAPLAPRIAHDRAIIAELTQQLPSLVGDPQSLWQADVMIGSAESDLRNWSAAASAWHAALAIHFDPTLAAQTAEAETRAHGKVTPEAAALFRSALAAAPADAPWRAAAEARLRETN
jgi:cytochrome c-type biogenesis protein CcmH